MKRSYEHDQEVRLPHASHDDRRLEELREDSHEAHEPAPDFFLNLFSKTVFLLGFRVSASHSYRKSDLLTKKFRKKVENELTL